MYGALNMDLLWEVKSNSKYMFGRNKLVYLLPVPLLSILSLLKWRLIHYTYKK